MGADTFNIVWKWKILIEASHNLTHCFLAISMFSLGSDSSPSHTDLCFPLTLFLMRSVMTPVTRAMIWGQWHLCILYNLRKQLRSTWLDTFYCLLCSVGGSQAAVGLGMDFLPRSILRKHQGCDMWHTETSCCTSSLIRSVVSTQCCLSPGPCPESGSLAATGPGCLVLPGLAGTRRPGIRRQEPSGENIMVTSINTVSAMYKHGSYQ